MLKSYLYCAVLAVVLLSATMQSCKKSDGTPDQGIVTPFSLYYADSSGTMYNTNDGTNIKPLVFPPDGFPTRAICTSGSNLLSAKVSLQVSTNNGVNFNPTFLFLHLTGIAQTAIYNSVDENRMFVASTKGHMGVYYSDNNGNMNTFIEDANYDVNISGSISITSFTELQNQTLVGYDAINNRSFIKNNKKDVWHETTGSTPLPTGGTFSISHIANTIVAIDYTGVKGAYYSSNNGQSWTAYTGLPQTQLLSVSAPFDEVLLVGTKSAGIYRLANSSTFVPANNGLGTNTFVNGIVGKENIYKDITSPQQYIFIATNQGLFRSNDLGQNWTLAQSGNIVAIY
jgi:hypothetical protein